MGSNSPSLPDIPPVVGRHFQRNPLRLLPPLELDAVGTRERGALTRPLCPPPKELELLAPWLGFIPSRKAPLEGFRPSTIGIGLCFPELKLRHHWTAWRLRGPTLEYIVALESAVAIAQRFGARVKVLMADNELLRDVRRAGAETSLDEARAMVDSVADWLGRSYPQVTLVRTTAPDVRGIVSAFVEEAALYPKGVARPWGRTSRDFWTQLDYLGNVALFSFLSAEGDALLMLDHDQLRPAVAATQVAQNSLAIGLYWPLPALDWPGFELADAASEREKSPEHLHRRRMVIQMLDHDSGSAPPRRMHRSPDGTGWLYLDATERELERGCLRTLAEIGAYVEGNESVSRIGDGALHELRNKLARLYTRLHARGD